MEEKSSGSLATNIAVIVVVAIAVVIGYFFVTGGSSNETSEVEVENAAPLPSPGDAAPQFSAHDLEGNEVSLADYAGRDVWLVFQATWCQGCRSELPDVQAAHETRDDIEVVGVYLRENASDVTEFNDRMGATFTSIPDSTGAISASYGVQAVPMHVFIDKDQTVRYVHIGVINDRTLDEAIEALA